MRNIQKRFGKYDICYGKRDFRGLEIEFKRNILPCYHQPPLPPDMQIHNADVYITFHNMLSISNL